MATYLSGIQSSGILTLGNYLGAIKQWQELIEQNPNDTFLFMIADLHSLTTISGEILRNNIENIMKIYYACGLGTQKNVFIFRQSEIPQHTELSWILSTIINIGSLERMTQFKDKSQKKLNGEINSGLLFYPVLMAADILLYDTDFVPVGADQKQHLELTQEIAKKFNNKFGNFLKIPQNFTPTHGSKIMSLTDGTKKMSKSDENDKSRINLTDSEEMIYKKISSAKTDSIAEIYFDKKNRPEISNLLEIFSIISKKSIKFLENQYKTTGMKIFKNDLSKEINRELSPIRGKFNSAKNSEELEQIYKTGREKALILAQNKMLTIKKTIGLI